MKAEDSVTIDLNGKSSIGDYMVVASGRSHVHVAAIADNLVKDLKHAAVSGIRVEGLRQGDWVLIDAGDVIVHVFRPEVRDFYNSEKMWSTARATRNGQADTLGAMRIVVAAVGRLKQGPETELSERFRKRAAQTGRNLGLRDVEIVEIRESRADDPNKRMLEESIALANIIPQGAAVVLLDAHGDNLDSASLAAQLSKWRRKRPAGGGLYDRRRRRSGAELARQGRIAAGFRRRHLAAPTGAHHAAGAALSRHHDPHRTSVSSGMTAADRS